MGPCSGAWDACRGSAIAITHATTKRRRNVFHEIAFVVEPVTAAICPNTLTTFTTIVNRIDQVHPKTPTCCSADHGRFLINLMSRFAKLILLPLLVVFSLLAAPSAMSSPPQDGYQTAAHHNDVEHDLNGHEECAAIACCLMPANTARPTLLERAAVLVDAYPVLHRSGEDPKVPAPPPKPLV